MDSNSRDPDLLYRQVQQLAPEITTVVLDEVQKVPRLLDAARRPAGSGI